MADSKSAASTFSSATTKAHDVDVDVLFVPVFGADDHLVDLPGIDEAVGGEFNRAVAAREYIHRPHVGVAARVTSGAWKARHIYFIGAGPADRANAERLWRSAAAAGYVARQRGATSIAWLVRGTASADLVARMAADGLSAAEFDGGTYKQASDRPSAFPSRVVVVAPGSDAKTLADSVRVGRTIGEASNFARGLANEPGNVLTPREFALRVSDASRDVGLGVEILDDARLRELGMGLLLGVAQGSSEPPRMVVLRHEPPGAPASPVLALVGKGVTFDSGGISIKPADGMERMKSDMSGGAAVAAAMRALAILRAPFRVIGLIPTVENMPGGRAIRPGDVIAGASGTTVEIINTDAEGRLILADALWYAGQLGATHVVDVATLTGACLVALGRNVSGLFGAPDSWVETVRSAGARAGDRLWPMPIYEETCEQLRSEIADLVNAAGRAGGACTAAAFLKAFAGDRSWAHLDIAGTAWAETKASYQPKGATGVAVRTLIELGMTGGGAGNV